MAISIFAYDETSSSPVQWRVALGVQMIPAGFLLLGLYFIPDSPRWLESRRESDKALASLVWLRAKPADDESVKAEHFTIQQGIELENRLRSGVTIRECLKPGTRNRFLAAWSVVFFLIFTGQSKSGTANERDRRSPRPHFIDSILYVSVPF